MKLGITGGICSGKSTVTNILNELGASTFSADDVAKKLTEPGAPLSVEIISIFGPEFAEADNPDAINRAALGNAVFHNRDLRELLNAVTHPAILAELSALMNSSLEEDRTRLVAVEVPLLYETSLEAMFDQVLVVWCSEASQISRLQQRQPALSKAELDERIAAQMPIDDKRAKANILVSSELAPANMKIAVENVYKKILSDIIL